MPEMKRHVKTINRKVNLETAIVTIIDVIKENIIITKNCFIIKQGHKAFISMDNYSDCVFKRMASMHPRDLITEAFGNNEEAMDLLKEAKAQGGLFYRGEFVRM